MPPPPPPPTNHPFATPPLPALAHRLLTAGPHKTLPTPRRVRIRFAGAFVADTTAALCVWEHPGYPYYYVPRDAFAGGVLSPPLRAPPPAADATTQPPEKDQPRPGRDFWEAALRVNGQVMRARVLCFGDVARFGSSSPSPSSQPQPPPTDAGEVATAALALALAHPDVRVGRDAIGGLSHRARVEFRSGGGGGGGGADDDDSTAWFEEDARVAVHPKDPFKRVDVVPSGRRVRVLLPVEGGAGTETVVVADTRRGGVGAFHLFETGLPRRFYLPATAVGAEGDARRRVRLRASDTVTECPYKGRARYYDVVVVVVVRDGDGDGDAEQEQEQVWRDLVWVYDNPTTECAAIAGCLCFYNEKVNIELDGVLLERPKTHFA
ncbi:hypothetical protein F4780DRAFT_793901 [Xylariomycetidae sp. FL0641]|nr:hypothetical protein F4780DRAFT_793901 [Xylariomycetidae sp. FL0641]